MSSQESFGAGDVFARRFVIESVLGKGAYGVVYRATDRITDSDTAIKILKPERLEAFSSRWREAAMLRRLDLPGVARLMAEGVENGRPFLAMEFVEGRSFPRPSEPLPWEMIEGYVVSLLRILALVHSAGLVHGDVKPGNVIINDFGQVKLVDFGLSLSAVANELESTRLHGTPLYMAPELFSGAKMTPQSDLFAVGTMIFEAMAGRPFFETNKMVEWVRLLKTKGPPLLSEVVENPDPVARRLADALLATNPSRRPSSAWEALSLIEGTDSNAAVEWLGAPDTIDEAIRLLEESGVVVGGPDGSGKSALVNQVALRLRSEGRTVHMLRVANRPFESLLRASSITESLPSVESDEELQELAESLVRTRIEDGDVFAVTNHTSKPDPWTLELLHDLAETVPGIIVATRDDSRANFTVGRFDQESLAELFCGPELAFHLPSRAAKILWQRTSGRRGAVFAEIESWKRFNLAQIESDGKIKVSDRSLTLLEQGLQTRSPVTPKSLPERSYEAVCWLSLLGGSAEAGALEALMTAPSDEIEQLLEGLKGAEIVQPQGAEWKLMRHPGYFDSVGERTRAEAVSFVMQMGLIGAKQRFRLALQSDEPALVYGAAVTAADEAYSGGFWHEAISILREAALFVRQTRPDSAIFDSLIRRWTRNSCQRDGGYQLEEVLWMLGDREHDLRVYLEALRLGAVSPGPETLELLYQVPDTGDPVLDRSRRATIMSCLARTGGDTDAHLEEVREWGEEIGDPEVGAMCLMWEARLCTSKEAFTRAAELAGQAAQQRSHPTGRLNSWSAQGSAYFENFQLEKAKETAKAIRREASRTGNPNSEVYAAILELEVDLRAGRSPEPDPDIIDCVRLIGYQSAESMARGQFAAALERRGEVDEAIRILTPAVLRERPVAGNSIGLMVATQLAMLENRRVPEEVIEASRNTNHRRHLATVLCADALAAPPDVARERMEEVFRMLASFEQTSFLYFINPTEVARKLGFDDLVD